MIRLFSAGKNTQLLKNDSTFFRWEKYATFKK